MAHGHRKQWHGAATRIRSGGSAGFLPRREVEGGVLLMPFSAALGPAGGQLSGLLGIITFAGIRRTLIKGHGDVRAESGLDLHALFRSQEGGGAVEVVLKVDSLLGNSPGFGKRPHLETSRIGQDGAVPGAEAMKSTHFPEDVLTRAKPQVVGVA